MNDLIKNRNYEFVPNVQEISIRNIYNHMPNPIILGIFKGTEEGHMVVIRGIWGRQTPNEDKKRGTNMKCEIEVQLADPNYLNPYYVTEVTHQKVQDNFDMIDDYKEFNLNNLPFKINKKIVIDTIDLGMLR